MVTGSRRWQSAPVADRLDDIPLPGLVTFVQFGRPWGIDVMVREWAQENGAHVEITRYVKDPGLEERVAGLRAAIELARTVDLVIVFRDPRKRSTWMRTFIAECEASGVPLEVIMREYPRKSRKPRPLSPGQRALLARMSFTVPRRVDHLARRLKRDESNVGESLRRLQVRGLVRRTSDGWVRSHHKKRGGK